MNEKSHALHEAAINYAAAEAAIRLANPQELAERIVEFHEAAARLKEAESMPDTFECHYCPEGDHRHDLTSKNAVTLILRGIIYPKQIINGDGEEVTTHIGLDFAQEDPPVIRICEDCVNMERLGNFII